MHEIHDVLAGLLAHAGRAEGIILLQRLVPGFVRPLELSCVQVLHRSKMAGVNQRLRRELQRFKTPEGVPQIVPRHYDAMIFQDHAGRAAVFGKLLGNPLAQLLASRQRIGRKGHFAAKVEGFRKYTGIRNLSAHAEAHQGARWAWITAFTSGRAS